MDAFGLIGGIAGAGIQAAANFGAAAITADAARDAAKLEAQTQLQLGLAQQQVALQQAALAAQTPQTSPWLLVGAGLAVAAVLVVALKR